MNRLQIQKVDPQSNPEAKLLVTESKQDFLKIYPPENSFALTAEAIGTNNLIFLVARLENHPIACGAIYHLEDNVGEIKSMYVRPRHRGQGYSKELLQALEKHALSLGLKTLRLETGDKQIEAIGLYLKAGYLRIQAFGPYQNSVTSVCMEKNL